MDREPKVGEVWKWLNEPDLPPFKIHQVHYDYIVLQYSDDWETEIFYTSGLDYFLRGAYYVLAYSTPLYKLLNS